MEAEWEGYVVYDAKAGVIRGATTSPHEAAEIASRYAIDAGQEEFVWDAAFQHQAERVAANHDVDFGGYPRRALTASRLPELDEASVMRIGLDDAIEVLSEEFRESYRAALAKFPQMTERLRKKAIARGEKAFDPLVMEWRGQNMVSNLLRTNYKLSKDYRDPHAKPAYIKGLNLVPTFSVFSGISGNDAVEMPIPGLEKSDDAARLRLGPRNPPATLCLGANKACMSTCLVFSGNSAKSVLNLAPKQSAARALVRHPEYFMRVLVDAIDAFMSPRRKDRRYDDFQRYVRLNVISDVPWELVAPWLFEMFPGTPYGSDSRAHGFYDYTKCVGRNPPPNYDLTFSFSGTNYAQSAWELDRGRRVAVVFFFPEVQREFGKVATKSDLRKQVLSRGRKRMYRDATWLNRPVIDGDADDVRPRDPGGVWVGLTWKPAKGWAGWTPDLFVLYAVKIDGHLAVAATPRHLGVPTDDVSDAAVLKVRKIIGKGRRKLPTELREGS